MHLGNRNGVGIRAISRASHTRLRQAAQLSSRSLFDPSSLAARSTWSNNALNRPRAARGRTKEEENMDISLKTKLVAAATLALGLAAAGCGGSSSEAPAAEPAAGAATGGGEASCSGAAAGGEHSCSGAAAAPAEGGATPAPAAQ